MAEAILNSIPEVAYALKDNIKYPGTAAQATAAEAVATTELTLRYPEITTPTIVAGSIDPE